MKATTAKKSNPHAPWVVGKSYFIRTITHHYTGKLVAVYPTELVILDAAWIADDGRFAPAMAGGDFSEVEPWPDGVEVIVGRGAILDACERQSIPRSQK